MSAPPVIARNNLRDSINVHRKRQRNRAQLTPEISVGIFSMAILAFLLASNLNEMGLKDFLIHACCSPC